MNPTDDMDPMDEAVTTLARRAAVMNVGLSAGGPTEALPGLIQPLLDAAHEVLRLAPDYATWTRVERPIPRAIENLLADARSGKDPFETVDQEDFQNFLHGRGRWAGGEPLDPELEDFALGRGKYAEGDDDGDEQG